MYYFVLVPCSSATILLRAVPASPLKVWMYNVYVLHHVFFHSFFDFTIFIRTMFSFEYFLTFFCSNWKLPVMFGFAKISYLCPRALSATLMSFVHEGLCSLMLTGDRFNIFLHIICLHGCISLNSCHTFFFPCTLFDIFLQIICFISSFWILLFFIVFVTQKNNSTSLWLFIVFVTVFNTLFLIILWLFFVFVTFFNSLFMIILWLFFVFVTVFNNLFFFVLLLHLVFVVSTFFIREFTGRTGHFELLKGIVESRL